MSWMVDAYEGVVKKSAPGTFTGKPLGFGGSLARTEATGYGVNLAAKLALEKLGQVHKRGYLCCTGIWKCWLLYCLLCL